MLFESSDSQLPKLRHSYYFHHVELKVYLYFPGDYDDEGGLSFEQAVKLGLYNVKTGRVRDPYSGQMLTLQDAIDEGLLNPRKPAITDITTGKKYSLREAMEESMVKRRDGRLDEKKIESMGVTLDPQFTQAEGRRSPLNFEDAILIGLFNLDSGQFMDPMSGTKMELSLAVDQKLIDTTSVMIVDPNSGDKVSLEAAIKAGLVDAKTGNFVDPDSEKVIMSMRDAFSAGLIESCYLPETSQVSTDHFHFLAIPFS